MGRGEEAVQAEVGTCTKAFHIKKELMYAVTRKAGNEDGELNRGQKINCQH